jgi:hypothetical protein
MTRFLRETSHVSRRGFILAQRGALQRGVCELAL